jgi:hypothetical protein
MASKPKQPFYFKVWNGTKMSNQGVIELKRLREERSAVLREMHHLNNTNGSYLQQTDLLTQYKLLGNQMENTREKYQTAISWCVCFMAHTYEGAEARLLRCIFKGSLKDDFKGYKRIGQTVYEMNINPERNSHVVDILTR